jgi:hypothetical protein
VNGVNVIANNVIISYFVSLLIEYVNTGGDTIEITDNVIDAADSISSTNGTSDSSNVNTALIIKFPLALINDLQSIVYYRRIFTQNSFGLFSDAAKALGLAVELYNSIENPTLDEILATTNVISVNADVYRFDFPSIDTYTSGFVGVDSITNIVNDTFSLRQDAIVISFPTEITGEIWGGNLTVEGDLVVGDVNLITALDETAKLASENVFTTSQEIIGNLKANIVQVAITTPTINSHLTSKLYVDTQLNLTGKLASANTFTANETMNTASKLGPHTQTDRGTCPGVGL